MRVEPDRDYQNLHDLGGITIVFTKESASDSRYRDGGLQEVHTDLTY